MRRIELDLCRIAACIMILMLHVAASGWEIAPVSSPAWAWYNFYDMIVRGAVPVFFMISGTLFLEREELSIRKILCKNVPHLLAVFLFWSVLYAAANPLIAGTPVTPYQFAVSVVKGNFHMWFLVAMISAYFFLPVVHGVIHGQKVPIWYLLILFGVYALANTNLKLIPNCPEIVTALCSQFSIYNVHYLGYMVLGYCLSKKDWGGRFTVACPIAFVASGAVFAMANRWYSIKMGKPTMWLYGNFSLPSLFLACCVFIFFLSLRSRQWGGKKWISYLSASTLGVYMLHVLLIKLSGRMGLKVTDYPAMLSVPVGVALLAVVCFGAVGVLRCIPVLRKCVQ